MIDITNDMEKVTSTDNAVAYFTASWCQPCKQLKPVYAKAGMQDEKYTYFVIDVDEIDSEYISKYNIKSVPTIFQMNKGQVERLIKSRTTDEIINEVNMPY
jgi:thioredoxin 1